MTARRRSSSTAAIWKAAHNAVLRGDASTLEQLLRENRKLFRTEQPPPYPSSSLAPDYSTGRARAILTGAHQFGSWPQFARFQKELARKSSPVAQFEAAVDAIVDGKAGTLSRLLRANPDLVHARSARKHRATLLHYVGANGVEDFRQRTPTNAPRIAEMLLKAGADVDAVADIYGGSTTLELAATSIHPANAGVLEDLVGVLVQHGAAVDGAPGRSIVNACLANGRLEAAELLARHGARLDAEGAAGLGRLDVIKGLTSARGRGKAVRADKKLTQAFMWACEYGHAPVVDFLLRRGVPVTARSAPHGQTGLHWAAFAGHPDVVRLLLRRGAPVNVKDRRFEGTPLGWTLHGFAAAASPSVKRRYYAIAADLVGAGARFEPETLEDEKIRGDRRMLEALTGKSGRGKTGTGKRGTGTTGKEKAARKKR